VHNYIHLALASIAWEVFAAQHPTHGYCFYSKATQKQTDQAMEGG